MPYTFLSQRNDLGGGPVSLIRDSIIRFFPQNRVGSLNGSVSCATRSSAECSSIETLTEAAFTKCGYHIIIIKIDVLR